MSFKSTWDNSKGFRVFVISMVILFVVSLIGVIVALVLAKKYTKSTTQPNNVEPYGRGEYIVKPPETAEAFANSGKQTRNKQMKAAVSETKTKTKGSNNTYLLSYINNS